MQSRHILELFYGFVLAAVLALGPPLAFLTIPFAVLLLPYLPIWGIGVIGLLFLGFAISGRMAYALGVALLALACALSPLGKLTMGTAEIAQREIKLRNFVQHGLDKKCAVNLAPLVKVSAKYKLIILDDFDTRGEQNYNISDTVAFLTGMRVVEIKCSGNRRQFTEAWETMAEQSASCGGEYDSYRVGISPRGSQRSIQPLSVNFCLRRTKIPDPSRDNTPAIVLTRQNAVVLHCDMTEFIERTASAHIDLGRVHYDSYNQRFYPALTPPNGVPQNNWILVLLSEVLQQDLSDKALMARAIKRQN
jgi:hypothetical protein